MDYIKILIIALIVILVAKFLFKVGGKELTALIINALVGFLIIWLINLSGLVSIPLNIITCLVAGVFGVPGVIVLILLVVFGVL